MAQYPSFWTRRRSAAILCGLQARDKPECGNDCCASPKSESAFDSKPRRTADAVRRDILRLNTGSESVKRPRSHSGTRGVQAGKRGVYGGNELLQLHLAADFLNLLLEFLSLVLGGTLFDGGGVVLHGGLGLGQALSGDFPDDLDDLNLGGSLEAGQDNVEGGLLLLGGGQRRRRARPWRRRTRRKPLPGRGPVRSVPERRAA